MTLILGSTRCCSFWVWRRHWPRVLHSSCRWLLPRWVSRLSRRLWHFSRCSRLDSTWGDCWWVHLRSFRLLFQDWTLAICACRFPSLLDQWRPLLLSWLRSHWGMLKSVVLMRLVMVITRLLNHSLQLWSTRRWMHHQSRLLWCTISRQTTHRGQLCLESWHRDITIVAFRLLSLFFYELKRLFKSFTILDRCWWS